MSHVTNDRTTPLWNREEVETFNQAHSKAKEIEEQILQKLSELVYVTSFGTKFPDLFASLKDRIRPVELESSPLNWIQAKVTKHLQKTGKVEIDVSFACAINKAFCEISLKTDLSYSDYYIAREFFQSYKGFLQRNEFNCRESDILNILVLIIPKELNSHSLDGVHQTLDSALLCVDKIYLKHSTENVIKSCEETFLSCIPRIVLAAAKSLIPLSSLCCNCEQRALKIIKTDFTLRDRYANASNDGEKYAIAQEILNHADEQDIGISLKLSALRTMSENNREVPQYFKTSALELCAKINNSKAPNANPFIFHA